MKRYLKEITNLPRFHISLYVIIPFIIMGFTVLAALVAFNLTQYHFGSKAGTFSPVLWATGLIAIAAFAAGVLLVRFILKPVERFVENARQIHTARRKRPDSAFQRFRRSDPAVYLCIRPGHQRLEPVGMAQIFFRKSSGKACRCAR